MLWWKSAKRMYFDVIFRDRQRPLLYDENVDHSHRRVHRIAPFHCGDDRPRQRDSRSDDVPIRGREVPRHPPSHQLIAKRNFLGARFQRASAFVPSFAPAFA